MHLAVAAGGLGGSSEKTERGGQIEGKNPEKETEIFAVEGGHFRKGGGESN